jgi:hypothetical protein
VIGFVPCTTLTLGIAVHTPHGKPEQSSDVSTWSVTAVKPVALKVSCQVAAPIVGEFQTGAPVVAVVKVCELWTSGF